jgi:hypothetical protein
MIWTTVVILMVLWMLGWFNNIGGQYVHLLFVAAGAVVIYNLIRSRQAAF